MFGCLPLRILFDTGATHCFIAEKCVAKLKLACADCPSLFVRFPDGARIRTGREVLGCPLHIGECEWPSDIIVMPLRTDDIILGMNFLSHYRAVIDLRTRTVTLLASDGSEHQVWGRDPKRNGALISAVRAARLIDQGCTGFWCYAVTADSERPSISEVPVVRDFADVFPDEVPGLPPQRDIDFAIELEPGTRPISRAPYRMAPSEMAELKTRLEELAEKGYIRPSASPWGAPVLFVKKKDG